MKINYLVHAVESVIALLAYPRDIGITVSGLFAVCELNRAARAS
jgi:hypothetical protein